MNAFLRYLYIHALKSQSCQDIFNTDAFIFRANNEQSKELSVHPAVKEVIGDLTKIRGKFEQCMRDVATPVFEERWAQWKEMDLLGSDFRDAQAAEHNFQEKLDKLIAEIQVADWTSFGKYVIGWLRAGKKPSFVAACENTKSVVALVEGLAAGQKSVAFLDNGDATRGTMDKTTNFLAAIADTVLHGFGKTAVPEGVQLRDERYQALRDKAISANGGPKAKPIPVFEFDPSTADIVYRSGREQLCSSVPEIVNRLTNLPDWLVNLIAEIFNRGLLGNEFAATASAMGITQTAKRFGRYLRKMILKELGKMTGQTFDDINDAVHDLRSSGNALRSLTSLGKPTALSDDGGCDTTEAFPQLDGGEDVVSM